MLFAGDRIEAYVGPREVGAADDLEQAIVAFIAGAKESLDIAVQEIDSEPIARSIVDARWRGVSVRMFVEQDYLRATGLPRVRVHAGETEAQARERTQWGQDDSALAANRRILSAFLRADIDVKGDLNPAIFHQKFVVRDARAGRRKTSALLSGSTNFTETDTHANLNHVVVFHHHGIAAEYQAEFERLRMGVFGRHEHGVPPRTHGLGGVPVKVLFAPDHTPELEIVKQLLKSPLGGRVDFAMFTFAGSSGIDDAMTMLTRAGIAVRGALDRGQAAQSWAAAKWLDAGGVELWVPKPQRESGIRKLHHKLLVIDDAIVVAGSFNYTAPANEFNDENLFVLGSPQDVVEKVAVDHDECARLTAFFRTEIERIVGGAERWRAATVGPAGVASRDGREPRTGTPLRPRTPAVSTGRRR